MAVNEVGGLAQSSKIYLSVSSFAKCSLQAFQLELIFDCMINGFYDSGTM